MRQSSRCELDISLRTLHYECLVMQLLQRPDIWGRFYGIKFKAALRRYLKTHSFYSKDKFF